MGLLRSWRFTGGAALVAVAALLLVAGASLSWSAAATGAPGTGFRVVRGVDAYQPDGGQPAVLEGEAERDQSPVNAGLLTALLLASFLGTGAGWQLACDRRQAAPPPPVTAGGPPFAAVREGATFLSVFRL